MATHQYDGLAPRCATICRMAPRAIPASPLPASGVQTTAHWEQYRHHSGVIADEETVHGALRKARVVLLSSRATAEVLGARPLTRPASPSYSQSCDCKQGEWICWWALRVLTVLGPAYRGSLLEHVRGTGANSKRGWEVVVGPGGPWCVAWVPARLGSCRQSRSCSALRRTQHFGCDGKGIARRPGVR